jgi:glycosyltransferase involved in cell wall biosynthesis
VTVSDEAPTDDPVSAEVLEGLKVCVVYDCLFPLTHGGAERWYRALVDKLVASGASVTYLTRRQWTGEAPQWKGVSVVDVSARSELYDAEGIRRTGPALAFGYGTLRWMLRHRGDNDAVITANFPFFSLLAIRGALIGTKTPVFVDFHEIWSSSYWRSYAGGLTGTLGAVIQRLCIRVTRFAQVFTTESERELRSHGYRGDAVVLAGLLPSDRSIEFVTASRGDHPMVLFVGRHVAHKGVRLLPDIFNAAREAIPNLTMTIVSDGPERPRVEGEVERLGLSNVVSFTGSVSEEELLRHYAEAACTVIPSLREGYGVVVGESVSTGTPVIVANNRENLATTLVEHGINGYVVEPTIRGMAEGIIAAINAGDPLRRSTHQWSAQKSTLMSMDRSLDQMVKRLSTSTTHSDSRRSS